MRLWALRNRVRDLFGLPPLPVPRAAVPVPPAPRVDVVLGRALPGVLVRVLPGLLVLLVSALAGWVDAWWLLPALGAVGVVARPRLPFAAGFLAVLVLWLVGQEDLLAAGPAGTVPGLWRVSLLVMGVHLVLATSALATHVAWRSVVEWRVLGRVLRTVLGGQAVVQTLLLLVAWLRAGGLGEHDWLRLVAVLGVVVLVELLVPREWLAVRRRPGED